jgi:hypothetical protein
VFHQGKLKLELQTLEQRVWSSGFGVQPLGCSTATLKDIYHLECAASGGALAFADPLAPGEVRLELPVAKRAKAAALPPHSKSKRKPTACHQD